jgi:hypothetical protein
LEIPFSYSGLTHERNLESKFMEIAKSISPNIVVTLEDGKSVSPPPGLNASETSPGSSSIKEISPTGKISFKGPSVPCQQAYMKSLIYLDKMASAAQLIGRGGI